MTQKFNQLLLAALARASEPLTSEDLVDEAVGLALSNGWQTEDLEGLTRPSVSARLRSMENLGLLKVMLERTDSNRRKIPAYSLTADESEAQHPIPSAPNPLAEPVSPYEDMTRAQILTLLEVHDEYLGVMARMMSEMREINLRARRRLAQAGLEFGQ